MGKAWRRTAISGASKLSADGSMSVRSGSTKGIFNLWAFIFAIFVSFSDRPGIETTFDVCSDIEVKSCFCYKIMVF
jgi:hypothetical protein